MADTMIKILAAARRHPHNRSLADFHRYWAETHGPMFANTASLRRYVQHLTLPEAYGGDPAPTYDGASIFWYDEYVPQPARAGDDPDQRRLARATLRDDAQLFDRAGEWPAHERRAYVVAREHVVVDGAVTPAMVKVIYVAGKRPGLSLHEFSEHWGGEHGRLGARVPGVRRYVQNHALPEAYGGGEQSHDGWSELWFDDLRALEAALRSPEWRAVGADGADLFAPPVGVVVSRERVVKDAGWTYRDWGIGRMTDEEIAARLQAEGYAGPAADPETPARLRAAAARGALAVWTADHLVTTDGSDIDVRPGGGLPTK